jgi:hypothetical protein
MATRENQGLQIALIIFLMITVGLAISTYYFFRQADEAGKEKIAANDAKLKSDSEAKSLKYQLEELKLMIGGSKLSPEGVAALKQGVTPDEGTKEIDRIKADFNADMALFDGTVPPENRNWRSLGRFLLSSIQKRSSDLEVAVDASKKAGADKDTTVAAEEGKLKIANEALVSLKKDITDTDKRFVDGVQASAKDKADLETRVATLQKEIGDQSAVKDKKIADLEAKIKGQNSQINGMGSKIKELTNESFERPHGQVTWVNMRTKTCYINLGRADGLQRQVTFSVYDQAITTLDVPAPGDERAKAEAKKEKSKRKASIEVIELLEDHLAECRILDDNYKDPILPGDQIFTPAWRPGQRLRFALVGRMNIDNDKEDDRQKVKNLIESNGGQIVCEVLENGNRVGSIDVNTRFLVIGDRPEDTADDKVRAAVNDIIGAAERNGVQQITVRDLVSMMGYKGTDRTVTLGKTGAADVEKKPETKQFRPRPKPMAEGAF